VHPRSDTGAARHHCSARISVSLVASPPVPQGLRAPEDWREARRLRAIAQRAGQACSESKSRSASGLPVTVVVKTVVSVLIPQPDLRGSPTAGVGHVDDTDDNPDQRGQRRAAVRPELHGSHSAEDGDEHRT
jgi:hypothetical protein